MKEGAKQVQSEGKGDKRAMTGNIVVNYTGVMFGVIITDGSTAASLPPKETLEKCVYCNRTSSSL